MHMHSHLFTRKKRKNGSSTKKEWENKGNINEERRVHSTERQKREMKRQCNGFPYKGKCVSGGFSVVRYSNKFASI